MHLSDKKIPAYTQLMLLLERLKLDLRRFSHAAPASKECLSYVNSKILPELEQADDPVKYIQEHEALLQAFDAEFVKNPAYRKFFVNVRYPLELIPRLLQQLDKYFEHLDVLSKPDLSEAESICIDLNLEADFLTKPRHHLRSQCEMQVADCFNGIFAVPYLNDDNPCSPIRRKLHGVQHVVRVGVFVQMFANLYRAYFPEQCEALTAKNLELISVAALLHDAGRDNDGKDEDEERSATMAFYYALNVLGYEKADAIAIAEAVMNKDYIPAQQPGVDLPEQSKRGRYWKLMFEKDGTRWMEFENFNEPKSILLKILHDADCLDIIRARQAFNVCYLEFYQMSELRKVDEAMDTLFAIVLEASHWIELQGDMPTKSGSFGKKQEYYKLKYECAAAYRTSIDALDAKTFPLLSCLKTAQASDAVITPQQLTHLRSQKKYASDAEETLNHLMQHGKVLVRAVLDPYHERNYTKMGSANAARLAAQKAEGQQAKPKISRAQIEVRKAMRRADKAGKHGNPSRPTTMIGYRVPTFGSSGYLIANPELDRIGLIAEKNQSSGFGGDNQRGEMLSREEKLQKLEQLLQLNKLGGTSATENRHNEIHYHIEDFDAVFMVSSSMTEHEIIQDNVSFHPVQTYITARYLQQLYQAEKEASGLPGKTHLEIFSYRVAEGRLVQMPEPTEDTLLAIWQKAINDWLVSIKLPSLEVSEFAKYSPAQLKHLLFPVAYREASTADTVVQSPDLYYPEELRAKIDDLVLKTQEKVVAACRRRIVHKLMDKVTSLDSVEKLMGIYHLTETELAGVHAVIKMHVEHLVAELQTVLVGEVKRSKLVSLHVNNELLVKIMRGFNFVDLEEKLTGAIEALEKSIQEKVDMMSSKVCQVGIDYKSMMSNQEIMENWHRLITVAGGFGGDEVNEQIKEINLQRIKNSLESDCEMAVMSIGSFTEDYFTGSRKERLLSILGAYLDKVLVDAMKSEVVNAKGMGGYIFAKYDLIKECYGLGLRYQSEAIVSQIQDFMIQKVKAHMMMHPTSEDGIHLSEAVSKINDLMCTFEVFGLLGCQFMQDSIFQTVESVRNFNGVDRFALFFPIIDNKNLFLQILFKKILQTRAQSDASAQTPASQLFKMPKNEVFFSVLNFLVRIDKEVVDRNLWIGFLKQYIEQNPQEVFKSFYKNLNQLERQEIRDILQSEELQVVLLKLVGRQRLTPERLKIFEAISTPLTKADSPRLKPAS